MRILHLGAQPPGNRPIPGHMAVAQVQLADVPRPRSPRETDCQMHVLHMPELAWERHGEAETGSVGPITWIAVPRHRHRGVSTATDSRRCSSWCLANAAPENVSHVVGSCLG